MTAQASNSPKSDAGGYMGDWKRGAPLGRRSTGHNVEGIDCSPFTLQRVRLDSGGYDQGGAYWGHGQPLYWYSATTDGPEVCEEDRGFEVSGYIRAHSRDDAKAIVRERHEGARFLR